MYQLTFDDLLHKEDQKYIRRISDNPEPVEKVKLYTKEGKRYGI